MMVKLGPLYRERELDVKDGPICIANFDCHIRPDFAPGINRVPDHVCQGLHSRVLHGLDVQ